jgi:3-methyladenine DNA glycosylase AlkD
MTLKDVMSELEAMGSAATKKVLLKHGIKEPFFGVKVGDMKSIQKRVKKDYQLSKELYNTGNSDAMYLAGLIADEAKMTKADLTHWVKTAMSTNIIEYTVPWIAAESNHGMELALSWIKDKKESVNRAGWNALCNIVALKPDSELDMDLLKKLLKTVEDNIHESGNRVKYTMNNFVISVAIYVTPLTNYSIIVAKRIGKVEVDMGDTECRIPAAVDYIMNAKKKGVLGKKKKMARC